MRAARPFKRKRAMTARRTNFKRPRRTRRFVAGRNRTSGYYGRIGGISGELKFHDIDYDVQPLALTNVKDSVNKIAIGTGESERIGRKCTIKQINWKYLLVFLETNAEATPRTIPEVRVILYLDKQANGATAADTDILETADVRSFRNLTNSGRFMILHDKLHTMNSTNLASDNAGVVSSSAVKRNIKIFKKCNIPLEFSGVAGAMAEIRSNNIGVLIISTSVEVNFNSNFRLRFSDH